MAPKSNKPYKVTKSTVGKVNKHGSKGKTEPTWWGKQEDQEFLLSLESKPHSLPNTNYVSWNDTDLSAYIVSLAAGIGMAANPGNNNCNNKADATPNPPVSAVSFANIPVEVLLEILSSVGRQDQVSLARAFPDQFMNPKRVDIFALDARHQLSIPTSPRVSWAVERARSPLLLEAIQAGSYSIELIARVLDTYLAVDNCFLDSHFPSNTLVTRNVLPPIYAAAGAGRLDIVQLLLKQGADASDTRRSPVVTSGGQTFLSPFNYAVDLAGRSSSYFPTQDRARDLNFEDIGLELAPASSATAYSTYNASLVTNFGVPSQGLRFSPEMMSALRGGLGRVALYLLQRYEANPDPAVGSSSSFNNMTSAALYAAVTSPFPEMAPVVTYMLNRGTQWRDMFLHRRILRAALSNGNIETAAAALQWQLENNSPELDGSVEFIASLVRNDSNIDEAKRLVTLLVTANRVNDQTDVVRAAIAAGANAFNTRQWLLQNIDTLNGVTLRHAIRHRDRDVVQLILEAFAARGISYDADLWAEPASVYTGTHSPPPPEFFSTPLTWALAQNNYYHAAHLLALGADPGRVRPNVRHRVRRLRDFLRSGAPGFDIRELVFRGKHEGGAAPPSDEALQSAMEYVFVRMLDDENKPIPDRVLRNPNLDPDDPANDSPYSSEWEEGVKDPKGKSTVQSITQTLQQI
ncbi:hypothetical protein F5Y19DRAFT_482780 [Xylariaceae sp. FL1651]|nr:hypothetical protein F5Y19DRAFT_482780 [Xylariaceae sp. FL1651]